MSVLLDSNVVSELIRKARDPAVATRNVRDFDDIGVDIVNPWTAA